jgi:poly(hydroxyalkanoate) depolymerase family esterase
MSQKFFRPLARLGRRILDALAPGRRAGGSTPAGAALSSIASVPEHAVAALKPGAVTEIAAFGDNPGALTMLVYVPPTPPPPGAPLIVVLHGCGQRAAVFAADAGWTALADRIGAPLLLPEQIGRNNPARCFNWFRPQDVARGGEMLSIAGMVAAATRMFTSDTDRVFVAGLSAGGAMAAAALAAYPELFAAGAVVAGLPVGGADSVTSAMALMGGKGPDLSPDDWAARAKALAPSRAGAWPRLSIWQGTEDRTVAASNAKKLVAQWTALHGLSEVPDADSGAGGAARRRVWHARDAAAVESWTIEGMAHGFPVDGGPVSDRFVLPVGIDATTAIARFWGLEGSGVAGDAPRVALVS